MGSPDSETGRYDREQQHAVTVVEPFAFGRCEVTVGEFRQFVEETDYRTDAEKGGGCRVFDSEKAEWLQVKDTNWRTPGFGQSENHPVTCVSHNDALAYIAWLNQRSGATYRLPSEAEWEYAARAGSVTERFWGEEADKACDFANVHDEVSKAENTGFDWTHHKCRDGYAQTAPVGAYRPNAIGLYDILGNVWEWTQDCWNASYKGAPADGSAWEAGNCVVRVVRGGSWFINPQLVRSASRFRFTADDASFNLGFRLARTL